MAALPPTYCLASIGAMRPVFLILMGLSLLLIAWRLTRRNRDWPSKILMTGAVLLALGYSVVIPLYQARIIMPLEMLPYFPDASMGPVLGWHLTKVVAMNGGWLLFGLGLALRARAFESRNKSAQTTPLTTQSFS